MRDRSGTRTTAHILILQHDSAIWRGWLGVTAGYLLLALLALLLLAVQGQSAAAQSETRYTNPKVFTLKTGIATGRMVYIGVGGDIDGQINPTLVVHEDETVQINLINGEGAEHDVVIDQYAAR